jgi:small-conductance mechanosensitive channel
MGNVFSIETWREALSNSLQQFAATVGHLLPALLGALLILLIGWGVSRLVQSLVRRALHRFGLDRTAARLRLTDSLRRANVVSDPSAIVSRILFWILMLTFLLAAAETLGLRAVTSTIDRVILYLPNVIAAAFIVVLGLLLGRFVQRLVESGSEMAGLPRAERLGAVMRGVVLLVAGVVAVEQLGLKTDILVRVITVLVATLGLTMGLAFALGARTVVTHILAGHYLRKNLAAGQPVEVGGRKGVVDHVGAVSTVFKKGDRSWSVPNAALLEDVVVQ